MKKPQLCLALSVSLTLMQSSLLAAQATPDAQALWQKKAHTPSGVQKNSLRKCSPKVATLGSRSSITSSGSTGNNGTAGHAMLFLSSKAKDAGVVAGAIPAAALTIHSDLLGEDEPTVLSQTPLTVQEPSQKSSQMVASNPVSALNNSDSLAIPAAKLEKVSEKVSEIGGESIPVHPHSNQLLAQLAPDQIISQADQSAPSTPFPPVVTGTVDLEEFKTTNVIDLKISQSRTFKLKNKIVRTSISDPSIAEPVVVSENQLVLLGKSPGGATLVLWDDAGNSVAVDLRVTRDFSQLQSALREVDPRIIVKAFSVNGSDRVLLLGDVDHPESVIRAFGSANVFMDDRGMNIQVANSRLINARIGETGAGTGGAGAGGGGGQISQLGTVDRFTYFPNTTNNIGKAQVITSDGGRVTSLIKVRKVPLIVLHCTFMEMNSVAARELGVQLGFSYTGNSFAFGVGGNNSLGVPVVAAAPFINQGASGLTPTSTIGGYTVSPTSFVSSTTVQPNVTGNFAPTTGIGQGLLNTPPGSLLPNSVLLGAPGGANFTTGNLQNIFFSSSVIQAGSAGRFGLNPSIEGIITHSRARILAEPTLVTISGERASFLAGGEIPIIQAVAAAGATAQSVVFEPFGLRLNIIPVLMENGNINLEVAPEERLISSVISFQPTSLSSSIPGFTTRKAQTIVEMKPGQELFIAGLLTTNSGRDMTKTPVLGEVPVLGALYRSKAFTKNESELVVAIRPEIIIPGTPGQLKLPEEIGRVEGPRDTNLFQVEPTVVDERHYTTGRSERVQKTSPTLPEGSPIPDNE